MNRKRSRNIKGRKVTVKDVAREANVSAMTVWRVVNGKTNVKQSTREKIERAIEKTNYQPNIGARLLAGSQSYQLLMLYNNPNVSWMGELLIGLMSSCRRTGYHLSLEGVGEWDGASGNDRPAQQDIVDLIDQFHVDGFILPPPICFDRQVLDAIVQTNIPCVRIAGTPMGDTDLRVSIDNCAAAYEITNHMISLGHKRIAIIRGPDNYLATALRYEGFLAALRDNDIDLPENYVKSGNFDVQSGNACARELLSESCRPTAIFAGNDEMAAGVLAAAQEAKISVPSQLSVAGFDDAPIARSVWPPLTTIRQPLRKIGEAAVQLLTDYIKHEKNDPAVASRSSVMLDYELVQRGTTAPAPND